jgi:hypothetical protein
MEEQTLIAAWFVPFRHRCHFALHPPRQAAEVSSESQILHRVEGRPRDDEAVNVSVGLVK